MKKFALVALATLTLSTPLLAENKSPFFKVYKDPSCGCCSGWMEKMDAAGMKTQGLHPNNLQGVKSQLGIQPQYRSCHTAVSADGYRFEGHVPPRYVEQFMQAPPKDAIGLAVPNMPVGSPGMEMGTRFQPYQVLLLKKDGSSEVYASVYGPEDQ